MTHKKQLLPSATVPTSLQWRNDVHLQSLAAQASSILLQRKRWQPLLLPLLPSKPPPHLILQILHRTHSHPLLSLHFFTWATSALSFRPTLLSLSKLAHLLLPLPLPSAAEQLLLPAFLSAPLPSLFNSICRASSCPTSRSHVFSFALQCHAENGSSSISNALLIFTKMRDLGHLPSQRSCAALLGALRASRRTATAWCVYASMVRAGVAGDGSIWAVLARLLCIEGKLERVVGLLELGLCGSSICDLVIDCYCKRGDFGAAIRLLNGMREKGSSPGFGTHSVILDAACKFGDVGVTRLILREMVMRELLPSVPFLDYNWVIGRLCDSGKTYAAELFVEKAQRQKFELGKGSYACMLRALSKDGRVEDAISVYRTMLQEGIAFNPGCRDVFVTAICNSEPKEKTSLVLKDAIHGGFASRALDISRYIAALCRERRWDEAVDLFSVAIDKGILPDSSSYCYLVKHYCSNGLVNSAVELHEKMKKLDGCLDVTSYNALLEALLEERRIQEASQVFNYMRERSVLNSASYVSMIGALCRGNELRKAMQLHDEILKVGLKPDDGAYKKLISLFA